MQRHVEKTAIYIPLRTTNATILSNCGGPIKTAVNTVKAWVV